MLLGVDYGDAKIGLALAEATLAEPYKVVANLIEVIKEIKLNKPEKIILGISEGESAEKAREFGAKLHQETGLEIIFQDETLSTQEAQDLSIEAGMKRSKRHEMEDAFSATLILQRYLDNL
jgi:putative holliday junction resolvase